MLRHEMLNVLTKLLICIETADSLKPQEANILQEQATVIALCLQYEDVLLDMPLRFTWQNTVLRSFLSSIALPIEIEKEKQGSIFLSAEMEKEVILDMYLLKNALQFLFSFLLEHATSVLCTMSAANILHIASDISASELPSPQHPFVYLQEAKVDRSVLRYHIGNALLTQYNQAAAEDVFRLRILLDTLH